MEIYTDGACIPNPGRGSWAFVVLDSDETPKVIKSGALSETTNNIMELMAIKRAVEYLIDEKIERDVTIKTDSRYCIGACSRQYRLKKNKALIKEIWDLIAKFESRGFELDFEFVRGHTGDVGNEFADYYAAQALK